MEALWLCLIESNAVEIKGKESIELIDILHKEEEVWFTLLMLCLIKEPKDLTFLLKGYGDQDRS